jgi:hypothetical protein
LRSDKTRHTVGREIRIQNLRFKAADEIERLREALKELMRAHAADYDRDYADGDPNSQINLAWLGAEAALAKK